jgi:hypothetical protein
MVFPGRVPEQEGSQYLQNALPDALIDATATPTWERRERSKLLRAPAHRAAPEGGPDGPGNRPATVRPIPAP